MKSIIKKNALWAIVALSAFTSCINNDDPYLKSSRDLAYITTVNDTKCAATSYGYITSAAIQNLNINDCYIVSYSYKTSDKTSDGIYVANEFSNISGDPMPQTVLKSGKPSENADDVFKITELAVPVFSPTKYFGDRWAITYTLLSQQQEKKPIVYFYYDKENQIDKDGVDISDDNKVIIDVDFEEDITMSDASKEQKRTVIGNLESLRSAYNPNFNNAQTGNDGAKYVSVLLQFRYKKYNEKSEQFETHYVGTWNTNSIEKILYMTFIQES